LGVRLGRSWYGFQKPFKILVKKLMTVSFANFFKVIFSFVYFEIQNWSRSVQQLVNMIFRTNRSLKISCVMCLEFEPLWLIPVLLLICFFFFLF
jgi:hypothetical protein